MVRVEDRVGVGSGRRSRRCPNKEYAPRLQTVDVFTRRNFHFHTHFATGPAHLSRPGLHEKMLSLYLILAAFVGLLQAKSSTGDSVLVILDNKLNQSDYSLFFGGLEGVCEQEFVSFA